MLLNKRNLHFSQQPPFTPGSSAVGRIAALGTDATSLKVGQLVFLDSFIRGRDDSTAQIIRGVYKGPTPSAKTLSHQPNLWRDGFWTEYSHTPLENCYHLDENDLLGKPEHGGLGYGIGDLAYMNKLALAYGGFRSIGLRTGQTIIITPATGNHGGAAVQVASAMGARVIAVGRNINSLKELQQKIPRVFPVQLTGELKDDLKILSPFGTIDAFLDFTPSSMTYPLHLKSCLAAVKSYGQGLLMGFPRGDYSLLYGMMIGKNINIRAQYMYERDDVRGLIKLVEMGILRVGNASGAKVVNFTLDQYDEAISQAAEQQTWGLQVVLRPFRE